jgi:F-type H+-transporting ATPase subunit b
MGVDWTIVAFEGLNFVVLVLILRRLLFRPVVEALEKRRAEIEAVRLESQRRQTAADAARAAYEDKLRELLAESAARLDEAMSKGRQEATHVIEAAQADARRQAEAAAQEIDAARRLAFARLRRAFFSLAADAAARVVRHMGAPSVSVAYARRGATALLEVLDEHDPDMTVQLTIADDDDATEIEAQVRGILGPDVKFEVDHDPLLVGGVRLRTAGHEVEASVSATLGDWYAATMAHDPELTSPALGHTG